MASAAMATCRLPLQLRRLPLGIRNSRWSSSAEAMRKSSYSPDEVAEFDDVLVSKPKDGVAKLTLNNPKKRNALSSHMMRVLQTQLDLLSTDKSIRAVILNANGPAFCAGHDLKEMRALREKGEGDVKEVFSLCSSLMQSIVTLPVPVIAQVEGIATAAGCQLVASCDMAVACSDRAYFATPGVNIGLFCSTPMVALSRNLGRKQSMEMLLTGTPLTAEKAASFGLINHAVAAEEVEPKTFEIADLIASKSGSAVRIGKEAFYRQLEMPLADAYNYCSEVMAYNMMENDAGEGVSAFIEKREPKWEH